MSLQDESQQPPVQARAGDPYLRVLTTYAVDAAAAPAAVPAGRATVPESESEETQNSVLFSQTSARTTRQPAASDVRDTDGVENAPGAGRGLDTVDEEIEGSPDKDGAPPRDAAGPARPPVEPHPDNDSGSFPTPPDSASPPATPVLGGHATGRPLTALAHPSLPPVALATQHLISPSRHAMSISPAKARQPLRAVSPVRQPGLARSGPPGLGLGIGASTLARAPSPPNAPSSDSFTGGLVSQPAALPHQRFAAIVRKQSAAHEAQDRGGSSIGEDEAGREAEDSLESRASTDPRMVRMQWQTQQVPSGAGAGPSSPPSSSLPRSSPIRETATLLNSDPLPSATTTEDAAEPPFEERAGPSRFARFGAQTDSQPGSLQSIFSHHDIDDLFGGTGGSLDGPSFAATQMATLPTPVFSSSTPQAGPTSSPKKPDAPRQSVASGSGARPRSTIPTLPPHRRLQRQSKSLASEPEPDLIDQTLSKGRVVHEPSPRPAGAPPAITSLDEATQMGTYVEPPLRTPPIGLQDPEATGSASVPSAARISSPAPPPAHVTPPTVHMSSGESLRPPPPRVKSPTKYGKRKRQASSPAKRSSGDDSDSSSAPEDPTDGSFRPPALAKGRSKSAPKRAKTVVKPAPVQRAPIKRASTRPAAAGPSKPLRGQSHQVPPVQPPPVQLPATPESESSPVPADPEDHTFRPEGAGMTPPSASAATDVPVIFSTAPELPDVEDTPSEGSAVRRVLAFWPNGISGFCVGTVEQHDGARGYRVLFDDTMSRWTSVEEMRLLQLRRGDVVRDTARKDAASSIVVEDWDGHGTSVTVADAQGVRAAIPTHRLYVPREVVDRTFDDRLVTAAMLGPDIPEVGTLARKVFTLTTGKKADAALDKEIRRAIKEHGGAVVDTWEELFDMKTTALRGTAAPFVIAVGQINERAGLPGKVMAALAAGIPIVGHQYIEELGSPGADWRTHLVQALHASVAKDQAITQVVNPYWGERDWDPASARAVRQLFARKRVVFLKSLPGKYSVNNTIVPFCLKALGAAVALVDDVPANLADVDYVLVEDRDKQRKVSPSLIKSKKCCNVEWLKQCLIRGIALPPTVMK